MRLPELLEGLGLDLNLPEGVAGDPEVTHVTFDSRQVGPGGLFLAVTGAKADGNRFLPAACRAGAVAALVDRPPAEDPGVPYAVTDQLRDLSSRLVARLHAETLDRVGLFAVTGTKGKTTTTRMLAAILNAGGVACGSVGTLGWRDRQGEGAPLANTTPDATQLAQVLARLEASGHQACALEASSQAAVQARIRHLPLRALAFLNLSPEHAELHPTYDDYRAAKARLFSDAAAARPGFTAVLPHGDPDGEVMGAAAGPGARRVSFGEDPAADVSGRLVEAGLDFLDLELTLGGAATPVRLPIGGLFNLQNALAAAALAHAAGVGAEAVKAGLEALGTVRGRFEVLRRGGVAAMVDYAHSADALEKLLVSCRQLTGEGRLLVVFGCGGKKDRGKRPKMGASAARHGDVVWVTNDNPRGEDPQAIADEVVAGVAAGSRAEVRIELNRRCAIQAALREARDGDLVVVAGKGHETEQDLGDQVIPFDDREEIRRFWAEE